MRNKAAAKQQDTAEMHIKHTEVQTKRKLLFWPLSLTAYKVNGQGGVSLPRNVFWHLHVASLSYRQFNIRFRLFYRSLVWCILEFTTRFPSLCGTSMLGVTSRYYSTHKINTLCVAASCDRMASLSNSRHRNLWLNKQREFTLKIEKLEVKSHGIFLFLFFSCWWYTLVLNQGHSSLLREFVFKALNHIDSI